MNEPASPLLRSILQHARSQPDAAAVIDRDGRRLTFAELARRAASACQALTDSGLSPGDPVYFAIRPGPEALVAGLAVLGAGATIVVADPGAGPQLLAARAELVGASGSEGGTAWAAAESLLHALTTRPLRGIVRRRGLLLPDFAALGVTRHLHTGRRLPGVPRRSLPLARLTKLPAPPPIPAGDADRPALVVFTSGTTAAPRGVVHTQATLAAGSALITGRVGWGPGDVVHTDQLMLGLPALAAGATWSLSGLPGKASRTLEHLRARRATHLFGTPAEIARVLDAGPLPATLRAVLLGAAPVPPPILRRLRQAAPEAQILAIYGTTEALPIAVATAEEKLAALELGDLLGDPLPGVQVSIADGAPGEIRVRSPHLAAGYLGDPEPLTELATGDLGTLDPDGRLVLLGRAKDMIIAGSFNLYPGLYEPAIAALKGVAEVAYVGVPDPVTADEEVVLAVVPEAGADAAALTRRLPAELLRVVDVAACPARIVVVDAIPRRGRTEKPDRDALRTLVAAR